MAAPGRSDVNICQRLARSLARNRSVGTHPGIHEMGISSKRGHRPGSRSASRTTFTQAGRVMLAWCASKYAPLVRILACVLGGFARRFATTYARTANLGGLACSYQISNHEK